MKKIISTLAVIIFIVGCSKNSTTPPLPVVDTCRDVSVRLGIKVASSAYGYFVEYNLTPRPDYIKDFLPPSNNNVVFNAARTYKVCKSTICDGEVFSGPGSIQNLTWYAPKESSSSLPFDAYIMFNSDTVFKKTSVYDTDYKRHMVSIIFNFPCLKKL